MSSKSELLFLLVALIAAQFTNIAENTFTDKLCKKPEKNRTFAVGSCVVSSSGKGSFSMFCSDDGTSFNQTSYQTTTCKLKTHTIDGKNGTCAEDEEGGSVMFVCEA
jgi:hypothetical protein